MAIIFFRGSNISQNNIQQTNQTTIIQKTQTHTLPKIESTVEPKIEITTEPKFETEKIAPTPTISVPTTSYYSEQILVEVTDEIKTKVDTQLVSLEEELIMLAKIIYREGRGLSSTQEKASIVWCVLNRVDSKDFDNTIKKVITARRQFAWRPNTPVKNEFYVLAQDVVTRWLLEKEGCSQVGRVLPENYLFFASHKKRNRYRQGYSSKKYWDWSLPNPYK